MKVDVHQAENSARSENKQQITQITLLMPVWGYHFTSRFLEFCLPTLLAPNNLPALARELPCRFILLSSEADVPLVRAHPAWRELTQVCAAEIELIDDLITHANHTATITLAFERMLRQAGPSMRNTCFFFLMSDYLVADGSLNAVLKTIRGGARAVLVGNFQVIAEDAAPLLRRVVDPQSPEIVLLPRELVGWSLAHLHPATVANIVNSGLTHNVHTNRLFWKVDETALIGRFYLMHPIAIHPEVMDFVIGSSWDYSFVPELCPSGSITTLTDSDEYLVVELQRRDYEWENLRPGPISAEEIASSLSLWGTAGHRTNVEQTLLFHAGDPPARLSEVAAQADAFVQSVTDRLSTPPVSHRGHPYWVGSMAMSRWRSNRPLNSDDWKFILNDVPPRGRTGTMLRKLRDRLFGFPPVVTRLHPWWPEYRLPLAALDQNFAANGRLLLVAQDASAFVQWAACAPGDVTTIGAKQLLILARVAYAPLVGTFDACFLMLDEEALGFGDALIARAAPLLKPSGKIYVLICNYRPLSGAEKFIPEFAKNAARLSGPAIRVEDVQYVEGSRFRWSIRAVLMRRLAKLAGGSKFSFAGAALTAGPILLATYLANGAVRSSRYPPQRNICSSIFVTLQVTDRINTPFICFENERPAEDPILNLTSGVSERVLIPEERYGIDELNEPMDLHAGNFVSVLAAYRFVANLMAGQHRVAEVGVANAFGGRLIRQKAEMLIVYDPRERAVAELRRQFAGDRGFDAQCHDMLGDPAPVKVDSIYSIDFLQYLTRDEEDAFIRNLRASLRHDFGFALVGSASFGRADEPTSTAFYGAPARVSDKAETDTQLFLSLADVQDLPTTPRSSPLETLPPNTAANSSGPRIYRRSGQELVALMKRYFHSVFAFSLVEQTIQPGVHPDARHVFALGCSKKQ